MDSETRNVLLEFVTRRGNHQKITFGGPPCLSPSARLCLEGLVDGGRFFDRNIQRSGGGGVILTERADTHIKGKFELYNRSGALNSSSGVLDIRIAGVESPGDVLLTVGNSGPAHVVIFLQGDFAGGIAVDLSGTHPSPALRLRITPKQVELHSVPYVTEARAVPDEVREGDVDIASLYDCSIAYGPREDWR
ncbi:MAG: hypothetical protein EBZ48_13415, partial [Proteobacteria bacterium]|nr:hypothetical protein [Pseudomonadota bacterium]